MILFDVARELFKMFVADFRLTIAVLAGVAVVDLLLAQGMVSATVAGGLLLVLCLIVLLESVLREAKRRAKQGAAQDRPGQNLTKM